MSAESVVMLYNVSRVLWDAFCKEEHERVEAEIVKVDFDRKALEDEKTSHIVTPFLTFFDVKIKLCNGM